MYHYNRCFEFHHRLQKSIITRSRMFQCTNDRETMPASRLATRRAYTSVASSQEIPVEIERGSSGTSCQPRESEESGAFEPGEQPSESIERRPRIVESFRSKLARLFVESKRDVPESSPHRKPI